MPESDHLDGTPREAERQAILNVNLNALRLRHGAI